MRWQKGFFVHVHRHRTRARYAGARHSYILGLCFASGACAAFAACPFAVAQTAEPVYESIVVGTPLPADRPREDHAASASVISEDRTPRAAETVPELLSEQAGVCVTRLGGLGSTATLSLRGSTPNQVLVYVDGVPFNSVTGGGVDLGTIPLGDVSRIEIYRGTSPIAFGASGIGGVVSITTRIPVEDRLDVEVGGGSFATRYGGGTAALNRGRWHVYAGLHALASAGDFPYLNTKGTNYDTSDDVVVDRHDNDLHQLDGVVHTVVDLSPERHLGLSVLFFDRRQGLPNGGTVNDSTARLTTRRATAILDYNAHGGGGDLVARAWSNYAFAHSADPDQKVFPLPTDARDTTLSAGATLDLRRLVRDWLTLSGMLDTRLDRFSPSDDAVTGAPATRLWGAAGLQADLWTEAWRLDTIASLRLEAAREETSGRDPFQMPLATSAPVDHLLPIARLSAVKELGRVLSLHANAGRYARLPSTIELYGNTGTLLGNPALKPESGFNVDVGPQVDWSRGNHRVLFSTAGFASWVDDLILYQYGGGHARPANLGRARILGVESELAVELGTHLRLSAAATFTDARDTSTSEAHHGQPLPLRPRYRCYARPELRRIAIGRHVELGVYGEVDATAGNYLDLSGLVKVDPRLLVGAGVVLDLPAGFSVRASGRNLSDSRIEDLLNYPLPGREFYLTLLWSSQNHSTKEPPP